MIDLDWPQAIVIVAFIIGITVMVVGWPNIRFRK